MSLRRFAVVVIIVLTFAFSIVSTRVALAAEPVNVAEKVGPKEGLTPCLAVAADGSPVYPTTTFPPLKRITVAFRLTPDVSGTGRTS